MQDTFIALAKALPDYHYDPKERGHFRNYLVGVLRNKALMALRKQNRDEEVLAEFAEETKQDSAYDVNPAANTGDWQKAVFEIALQQLVADPSINDRTKQIFIRTAIREENPNAVAAALGVSRNVVDQQKRRVLAKFKELVAALKGVV